MRLDPERDLATRAVQGGGARLNDERVEDEKRVLSSADLRGDVVKLSVGRKKHALLKAI